MHDNNPALRVILQKLKMYSRRNTQWVQNQPAHKKMVLITQATSQGSGEPAHKRSLARAFAVRRHVVETLWKFVCSPNRGPRMRIWRATNRETIRSVFFMCRLNLLLQSINVPYSQWRSYVKCNISHLFITKTHLFKYILKILPPKNEKFLEKKNLLYFHIPAQNIDCGYSLEPPRRGGSNEYPQSMFWAKIRNIIYTPVNPSFII